jgi:hypothetical protein
MQDAVGEAVEAYIEDATKAQLQSLHDFLSGPSIEGREVTGTPVPTTTIRLLDQHNQETILNLETGEFTSRAMGYSNQPNSVVVTGTGPRLTLDLRALYLPSSAIEFDPPPDQTGAEIAVTFDDPEAVPAPTRREADEETPADEEPEEEETPAEEDESAAEKSPPEEDRRDTDAA